MSCPPYPREDIANLRIFFGNQSHLPKRFLSIFAVLICINDFGRRSYLTDMGPSERVALFVLQMRTVPQGVTEIVNKFLINRPLRHAQGAHACESYPYLCADIIHFTSQTIETN